MVGQRKDSVNIVLIINVPSQAPFSHQPILFFDIFKPGLNHLLHLMLMLLWYHCDLFSNTLHMNSHCLYVRERVYLLVLSHVDPQMN